MAGPLAVNQHSGELTRVGGGGDGGGGCGGGAALGAGVGMGAVPLGIGLGGLTGTGHIHHKGIDDRFDTPDPLFFGC